MTATEIAEVDPVTKQYPFLLVTTNSKAIDLSATLFVLCKKHPSLLERHIAVLPYQALVFLQGRGLS